MESGAYKSRHARAARTDCSFRAVDVTMPQPFVAWGCEVRRDLRWDDCWNVRDLGGYPTRSGGRTRYGRIVRAGNLSRLTATGKASLLAYGVTTIVDLRDPRELEIEMDPFHERGRWAGQVAYRNVPLISQAEWAALEDPALRSHGYALTVDLSRENVGRVMAAIADTDGMVVVHCHAGKERAGVVSALLLELAGVPEALIAQDFVASDLHLQAQYDEWSRREPDPERRTKLRASFRSTPAQIRAPLEHVRSHGGAATYLRDAGLSQAQVSRLRGRLLDQDGSS